MVLGLGSKGWLVKKYIYIYKEPRNLFCSTLQHICQIRLSEKSLKGKIKMEKTPVLLRKAFHHLGPDPKGRKQLRGYPHKGQASPSHPK